MNATAALTLKRAQRVLHARGLVHWLPSAESTGLQLRKTVSKQTKLPVEIGAAPSVAGNRVWDC
jgi:hypothetical protein